MRHHQAQRDTRMVEHGGTHGTVAVQIDIVLHRPGEFRSRRPGGGFVVLAALALRAGAAGLLARKPALVAFDRAAMRD